MNPKTAVETLRSLGWSDNRIAVAVNVTQPTIWKIRNYPARSANYELGSALVRLAKRESRKANQPVGAS